MQRLACICGLFYKEYCFVRFSWKKGTNNDYVQVRIVCFGLKCCINWRVLCWSTGPGWRNALISMLVKIVALSKKWLSHRHYVQNSSYWLGRKNVSEIISCFLYNSLGSSAAEGQVQAGAAGGLSCCGASGGFQTESSCAYSCINPPGYQAEPSQGLANPSPAGRKRACLRMEK